MRIIADTNIWYYLGQDKSLYESVKAEPIAPTFVNIYELSKSDNVIDKEELSRAAMQKLFAFAANTIYEPPFIHIAKLHTAFEYDPVEKIGHFLEFTSKFAKGHSIEESKKPDFRAYIDSIRADLQYAADVYNNEASTIRQKITSKKDHKKEDTLNATAAFIDYCVKTTTNNAVSLDGFDFTKIELLLNTLDHYFKTLETSQMKIKDNDWFDFAILSYVQPGDKIWTCDKRWVRLINECGFGEYLYTPPAI